MPNGSARTDRRRMLRAGASSLAGIGVAAGLGRHAQAASQTPPRVGRTFIITAEAGSLAPADDGAWELRLDGLGQQIMVFTDMPNLHTELVSADDVFAQVVADAMQEVAALTIKTDAHHIDTLALRFESITHEPGSSTATFRARLLNAFTGHLWQGAFEAPVLVVNDELIETE